jgi:hypothetical protein
LHVLSADGGTASRSELPLLPKLSAWSLHRGDLLFAAHDGAGWKLWRQPLAGGDAVAWRTLRAASTDGRIVIDAAGRAILSHIDEFAADLMRVPAAGAADTQSGVESRADSRP